MDNYNPIIHGAVRAIRIFTDWENACTPMAELIFASGVKETIQWNSLAERKKYADGITAYTIFFDERTEAKFEDFMMAPSVMQDDLLLEQQEQM